LTSLSAEDISLPSAPDKMQPFTRGVSGVTSQDIEGQGIASDHSPPFNAKLAALTTHQNG